MWGEAGIGKTWAAQGLLRQTSCKGFAVHATAPLSVVVRALPRPVRLPLWSERLLERLERDAYTELGPTADALAALLAALAPIILHLEDLHEASPEHHKLIQALAQRVSRTRGVVLLVTSRLQPPEAFEAVRLEPLEEYATSCVVEAELGAALPHDARRWIYQRAKGNPLFSLEYLRHLTRTGHLWSDGKRWHWREPPAGLMPLTVEALIEQQILEASTSERVRRTLEARAMLPLEVGEELWARVAGLEAAELKEARTELLERGILRGSEFTHPLFREVRLKTLRPERKQALARRALEALANDPEAAAAFVEEAGLEPPRAKAQFLQAALSARSRGNEVQAARFLARAVEYAEGEERGRLALEAAQIL